jgi:uncharacterized coiled-coil protein SlyX
MAVAQGGNRGGLVTALVVFVVLFFVAAIFAVVKSVDAADAETRAAKQEAAYKSAIASSEMTEDVFTGLQQNAQGRSVYNLLLEQRNALASFITGQNPGANAFEDARNSGNALIANINESLKKEGSGAQVSAGSMTAAMTDLSKLLAQRQSQVAELNGKLAQATQELNNQVAIYAKQADEYRKNVEAARQEASKANELVNAYRTGKDEDINRLEKNLADTIEGNRKTIEELNTQLATRQQEMNDLTKKLQASIDKHKRQTNSADVIVRRADGVVLEVQPANKLCFINRGLGHGISPGMTFQIYDKAEGLPRVGNLEGGIDELPPGKGSLEVTRVGQGSSECRIITLAAGTQIMVGDLIANLIYDPNVKLRFKVYGEFDVNQDGRVTAEEADVIRRLIVQWGGQLSDDVNVDTDFVVLGAEPSVPQYTAEELQQDPTKQFQVDQAQKARDAYNQIRDNAIALHIPVLNQNRFLYMTGFYDQARR